MYTHTSRAATRRAPSATSQARKHGANAQRNVRRAAVWVPTGAPLPCRDKQMVTYDQLLSITRLHGLDLLKVGLEPRLHVAWPHGVTGRVLCRRC